MNPKLKNEPAPKQLDQETKDLVKAECLQYFGPKWRAEGKAQATLAMKVMVPKLEAMLAQERAESNRKLAAMAEQLSKAMVIISVLQDAEIARMSGSTKAQQQAEFGKLCTLKDIQMRAVGGRA